MIVISENLHLQDEEVHFKFSRASGPGGQHVNKTASAVQVWFDARACTGISNAMLKRLQAEAGRKLSPEGVLTLRAEIHSSQHRNKEEVVQRLIHLLRKVEKPKKYRVKTRPSRASNQRRLDSKAHNRTKKQSRGKVTFRE